MRCFTPRDGGCGSDVLGCSLAGHLVENGTDFAGLLGVEGVRLEQVEDQQAGLPLVELVHQALDAPLLDVSHRDGWSVSEGLIGPVAILQEAGQ